MRITVACVCYVGLSLAVLLAQHHKVTVITTTPKKADRLNQLSVLSVTPDKLASGCEI